MNKSSLLRYLLPSIAGVFILAAMSPAPLVGHRPGGTVPNNVTRDNDQTLQSQGRPPTIPQIGATPDAQHVDSSAITDSSPDGQAVLAAASSNRGRAAANGAESAQAKQVLGEVQRRSEHPDGGHSFVWAILVVGCIGGGIYGLKRWVDVNTPELSEPTPTKPTW